MNGDNDMSKLKDFEKDLAITLNKHGLDNMCDTPDFVLAEMISTYLGTVKQAMQYRGFAPKKTTIQH